MKIVNDKIYIARGETPTYDVKVKDRKTGVPFILPSGLEHPIIEFVVRPSVYSKGDDFAIKKYLDFTDYPRFDDVSYFPEVPNGVTDADNKPLPGDESKLHKYARDGETDYYYYTGSEWKKYEFQISFTMLYDNTSKLEEKTYKYEVALFGAEPLYKDETKKEVIGISGIYYKKPLLEATDFIVGGSLSE